MVCFRTDWWGSILDSATSDPVLGGAGLGHGQGYVGSNLSNSEPCVLISVTQLPLHGGCRQHNVLLSHQLLQLLSEQDEGLWGKRLVTDICLTP